MVPENPSTGPPPPPKGGMTSLSLYANLLDPSSSNAPGTISRAPVVFKQPSTEETLPEDPAAAAKQKALNIGT